MSSAEIIDDAAAVAAAQRPAPGEVFLDHLGLFVPDLAMVPMRLEQLGFRLTPEAVHEAPGADGRAAPTGTANRCAMFRRGYLEVLGPTADTPLARQLKAALARCPGLHLIAFSAADSDARHDALPRRGFTPQPLVRLERPVETATGRETARFHVLRLPPGTMPEGRVQICTHFTPGLLWQPRHLDQPNGAVALSGVLLCVLDPAEAAARFARFLDLPWRGNERAAALRPARGRVDFVPPDGLAERLPGIESPALPWIAAMALQSADLAATCRFLRTRGVTPLHDADGRLVVAPSAALGMTIVFHAAGAAPW